MPPSINKYITHPPWVHAYNQTMWLHLGTTMFYIIFFGKTQDWAVEDVVNVRVTGGSNSCLSSYKRLPVSVTLCFACFKMNWWAQKHRQTVVTHWVRSKVFPKEFMMQQGRSLWWVHLFMRSRTLTAGIRGVGAEEVDMDRRCISLTLIFL